MFNKTQYQLDALANYPNEQWRLAIQQYPPPSNRPPQTFWRTQRNNAIAWLQSYGVNCVEIQGKVFINKTGVDLSYVE